MHVAMDVTEERSHDSATGADHSSSRRHTVAHVQTTRRFSSYEGFFVMMNVTNAKGVALILTDLGLFC